MSTDKWRYTEECEGRSCVGDCDYCDFETDTAADEITKLAHDAKLVNGLLEHPDTVDNLRRTERAERELWAELRKEQRNE